MSMTHFISTLLPVARQTRRQMHPTRLNDLLHASVQAPFLSFPHGSLDVSYQYDVLTYSTQNMMKGYIARERGIIVLSKAGAFPGTKI
jgi:hypothetical protein